MYDGDMTVDGFEMGELKSRCHGHKCSNAFHKLGQGDARRQWLIRLWLCSRTLLVQLRAELMVSCLIV